MIETLSEYINYTLTKLIQNGAGEIDIVRQFVDALANDISLKFPDTVNINTGFIHQKPYAMFVTPPNICGRTRTELGDILFVVKFFVEGQTEPIEHRASFCQVKIVDQNNNWEITSHQIDFFSNISDYTFRFGKKVTENAGYEPISWNISADEDWFSHYLLMSKIINIGIDTKEVGLKYNQDCKNFTFGCCLLNSNANNQLGYCSNYSFDKFFKKFLAPGGIGFNVGDYFSMVDIIYKKLGMVVDPPEEHEGFFNEDAKGGFAIIEFNITLDE